MSRTAASASASASPASPAASSTAHRSMLRAGIGTPSGRNRAAASSRRASAAGRSPDRKATQRAVEHRVDRFEHLAGLREQPPGGDEIGIRAVGEPERQVNKARGRSAPGPSTACRPRAAARSRRAQVVKGRRVPAERPQRAPAPVQHPRRRHAAGHWTLVRKRPARPLSGPRRQAPLPGWPAHRPRARPSRFGRASKRAAQLADRRRTSPNSRRRSRRPDGQPTPHTGPDARRAPRGRVTLHGDGRGPAAAALRYRAEPNPPRVLAQPRSDRKPEYFPASIGYIPRPRQTECIQAAWAAAPYGYPALRAGAIGRDLVSEPNRDIPNPKARTNLDSYMTNSGEKG